MATRARAGHLDRRLLWDYHGITCQAFWGYLGPWCRALRARVGDPFVYEHFEWLSGEMDAMDRGAGRSPAFSSEAVLIAELSLFVNSTREHLRIAQSLRTVIIASPEVVPAAAPATRAAAEG